jgi:hypothetical protein
MTTLFSFLMAIMTMSQQMFLNDSQLCRYLEKVFTEAPADFAPFKGQETTTKGVYQGTLKLGPASDCKLTPRRETDDGAFPPQYVCTLGQPLYVFDEARTLYDLSKEGLRACLSGFVFEERRRGGDSGYAAWTFRGYKPGVTGVRLVLRLTDTAGRIAAATGKDIQEVIGPTVVVDITVDNTN